MLERLRETDMIEGLALIAYAFLIPTDVTSELEVQHGLGMDMYRISMEQIVLLMKVCVPNSRYLEDERVGC